MSKLLCVLLILSLFIFSGCQGEKKNIKPLPETSQTKDIKKLPIDNNDSSLEHTDSRLQDPRFHFSDWPKQFKPQRILSFKEGMSLKNKMYLVYQQNPNGIGKNDPDISSGQLYQWRTVHKNQFILETQEKVLSTQGLSSSTILVEDKITTQSGETQSYSFKRKFVEDERPYRGFIEGAQFPFIHYFKEFKSLLGEICQSDLTDVIIRETQFEFENRFLFVIGTYKMADGKQIRVLMTAMHSSHPFDQCKNKNQYQERRQNIEIITADLVPGRSLYSPQGYEGVYTESWTENLTLKETRNNVSELLTAPVRKNLPSIF